MLSLFRHGPDQNLNKAQSAQIVAHHSPTDSDPICGKTSSSSAPSEYRSSESSSPAHSLESPEHHVHLASNPSAIGIDNGGEIAEDLSLRRKDSSSSTSSLKFCAQCLCEFANEHMLQMHIAARHSSPSSQQPMAIGSAQDDDQSVRCDICGVLLLDPNYLQKHMEEAHSQEPLQNSPKHDLIKCPECSQSFIDELKLREHLFDSHMSFSTSSSAAASLNESCPQLDAFLSPTVAANRFCMLCKLHFETELEYWSHVKFQHLHDSSAADALLNLQQLSGGATSLAPLALRANSSNNSTPTKFDQGVVDHQSGGGGGANKIFNPEAYCELCDKEFCNKYFLKTHKTNKHSVIYEDASPASMVLSQRNSLGDFSINATTPPLLNSSGAKSAPLDGSFAGLKNGHSSLTSTVSSSSDDYNAQLNAMNMGLASSPYGSQFPPTSNSAADLFCPLCHQFFPNSFFLQSHMITAHAGVNVGAFGPNFNSVATMYAMMGASTNPFLQQMKLFNPQIAAAMFGMMPPTQAVSPQLPPSLVSTHHQQQLQQPHLFTSAANLLDYHYAASSQNGGKQLAEIAGNSGNNPVAAPTTSSSHKDAFCDLCQKEFCNKYFLKTHRLNKHGILDESSESPIKKMKLSPEACHANELLGIEAGEIVKNNSNGESSLNLSHGLPASKVSPLSEALNKPPMSQMKLEPPTEQAMSFTDKPQKSSSDLNASASANSSCNTTDAYQQQQVSCTLCMKSFPTIFALVAHKYRDHGSFDGNINLLAAAMNAGGQSSPILSQTKMEASPQRVTTGLSSACGAAPMPTSVDPDAYCEICKKEFCSKYFLRTHKLNIHGIVTECSPTQSTNNASGLVTHQMNSNTKELTPKPPRPLVTGKNFCDICNKELCNKYFLRTHMLKMHGIVIDENKTVIGNINTLDKEMHGQLLFRCDICNKELGTRQQLKIHKQTVHSITSSSPNSNSGTPCSDLSNKIHGVSKDQTSMPPNVTISMSFDAKHDSADLNKTDSSTIIDTIQQQIGNNSSVLSGHKLDKHSELPEVCTLCSRRFKNAKWLRAHFITDHSLQRMETSEASLACEYCAITFGDQVQLQMHVIDAHQKEVEGKATSLAEQAALDTIGAFSNNHSPSNNEPCDLTFGSKTTDTVEKTICATVDEIASGRNSAAFPEQDQNCAVDYRTQSVPSKTANNATRTYKCSYCNYSTRWISNLSTHEKRHNAAQHVNGTERPFVCRVCLRAYRYAHSLQRHSEVHRLSSYGLQMQMNSSILNSSNSMIDQALSSPAVADLSSSQMPTFPSTSSLLLASHSPTKKLSNDDMCNKQQFQCAICDKIFRNRELFRMHMLSIHKTSPPKDASMQQTFGSPTSTSSVAANHTPTMSPKKIYRCKICGVGTRVYNNLCAHLVESHGITPKQKSNHASRKLIDTSIDEAKDQCRPKTPEVPKSDNIAFPVSHGTPQRSSTEAADNDGNQQSSVTSPPFIMQPFLMRESVESGVFVTSVVYLPVTQQIDSVVETKFTFIPIPTNNNIVGDRNSS